MTKVAGQGFPTGITGVGKYFPEKVVTNHDLEKLVETDHDWIVDRTGIHERRFVEPGVASSDLAVHACQQALDMAGVEAAQLDGIILATVTPDMMFPSAGCTLQHKLGARRAWAFDLSAACSGWVYAAGVADSMIRSGAAQKIMVVGVDVMTSILDMTDRNTCILFGDGAGATLFERLPQGSEGMLAYELGADGGGGGFLYMPAGGSAKPASAETVANREHSVIQDGPSVFRAAVEGMARVTLNVLDQAGATGDDVALFVPHQANMRIIDYAARKAKLDKDKVMVTIDRFGNTTAATIPTSLCIAHEEGRLAKGDLVLASTFGAGFTWGGAAFRWILGG
jgi:3-oxoacyl-[acyl-carrier-protein] synthase III